MSRLKLIPSNCAIVLLLVPALASADHGLGIGAQAMLSGPVGASVTYDAGQFHIDGIFAVYDDDIGDDNDLHLGARFYYMIHERGVSDLSVGGGIGIVNDNDTDLHIEGSAKIRVWLVSNVSFSTAVGLGFVVDGDDGDDNDLVLGSQLRQVSSNVTALLGITYHFE